MANVKPRRSAEEIAAVAARWRAVWTPAIGISGFLRQQLPAIENLLEQRWALEDVGRSLAAAGIQFGSGKGWTGKLLASKISAARRQVARRQGRLIDANPATLKKAVAEAVEETILRLGIAATPLDLRAAIDRLAQQQPANSSPLPRLVAVGEPSREPVSDLARGQASAAVPASGPTPLPPVREYGQPIASPSRRRTSALASMMAAQGRSEGDDKVSRILAQQGEKPEGRGD